jgi:hypothetical protein
MPIRPVAPRLPKSRVVQMVSSSPASVLRDHAATTRAAKTGVRAAQAVIVAAGAVVAREPVHARAVAQKRQEVGPTKALPPDRSSERGRSRAPRRGHDSEREERRDDRRPGHGGPHSSRPRVPGTAHMVARSAQIARSPSGSTASRAAASFGATTWSRPLRTAGSSRLSAGLLASLPRRSSCRQTVCRAAMVVWTVRGRCGPPRGGGQLLVLGRLDPASADRDRGPRRDLKPPRPGSGA